MEEYSKVIKEGGYKVLDKVVFKVSNNAVNFLNEITTNDMDKNTNAFIDRLGKLIALVDQIVIKDEVYLVVEKKYKDKFLENINKYIKFSESKIEELTLKAVHIIGNKEIKGIKI